jgi:PAS domain S-box-containing protein
VKSTNNSVPPFWIVNFGVKIDVIPQTNYSVVRDFNKIPSHLSEHTELIILLDQQYFDKYQSLNRRNYKLILVCAPNQIPPSKLFQEASYCLKQDDTKLILNLLNPYLQQINSETREVPKQLHLICDEKGAIIYNDKCIFNFLNLPVGQKLSKFSDIPIKFRFGELKSFEPVEGLLKFDQIHRWLSLRSTKKVDIFRVYLDKTIHAEGDKTYHTFNFNLWPEKSQLEESYKANVNAFTGLLEESFDAILISDSSRIIKYASPGITRLAGYKPEELIGLDTADFTLPEDAVKSHAVIAQVRESKKERVTVQHRIRHKNGSYIWIEVIVADRRNTPGIDGIVSSVRDINAEKLSRLALEEGKLRFELASRASKDVLWDLDCKTNRIEWGENVEAVFGWKAEELNSVDKWMSKIPSKQQRHINKSFELAFKSDGDLWSCRYDFQSKNGSFAAIEDRGYLLRDKDGSVYRLIGAMHDNTNTKLFENQLSKGEEKFRRLFEESLIGVSLIRLEDFLCLDGNQALLNILGYRREEILKMSLLELIPEESKDFFYREMDILKKSEGAISFQLDFIRKDQSIIKVALSSFTTEEENNEKSAWMHILDLSPIIESSVALKAAENRFRSYIEKSSDVFVTLNEQSIYEYVSPNISKLLGYQPSEVIGLHNFDLIHPDDHESVIKAYSEADGEIGKVTRSIFRGLRKDGSTRWVEANGKIEHTDQGLKAFINIRDIDKEHQNEEELRRLSLVANKTENAVIITDEKLAVVWVNKSFENLSGFALQETLNEVITNKLFSKKVAQNLETDIAKGKALKLERKGRHKLGKKFWLDLNITPVYNSDGLLQNYIFIALDISNKRKQNKQIQQNLRLINEQNNRLKSFAHLSSHSFLAHCQNIEALANELKRSNHQMIQSELVQILNETTRSLSASLASFQSILKTESQDPESLEELNVAEFVDKAKKLLAHDIIVKLANIEYQGDPYFSVRYFPAYLEDAFYTIFAQALAENKSEGIDLFINCRKENSFKVIELDLPITLRKKKKHSPSKDSSILFSFSESIDLIKGQLHKNGGELKLQPKDNFGMLLSFYFKDSD